LREQQRADVQRDMHHRRNLYGQRIRRMLVRPAGGALVALARRDRARAGFHAATLRGRLLGLSSK